MDLENLDTFDAVWTALGGNKGVADLTGAKPSTLSMWRKADSFPTNTYVMITAALRAIGKTAPDSLWGMKAAAPERESAA